MIEDKYRNLNKWKADKELTEELTKPFSPYDVEILPDNHGTVYLGHDKLTKRLNDVLGVGCWAIVFDKIDYRECTGINEDGKDAEKKEATVNGILYIDDSFITDAEATENNPFLGKSDSIESARSSVIRRLCKHCGIGLELWNSSYIEDWKENYASQIWVKNKKKHKDEKIWFKKGAKIEYPYELKNKDSNKKPEKESSKKSFPQKPVHPSQENDSITDKQKALIEKLLKSHVWADNEKVQYSKALPKMSKDRAKEVIDGMVKMIDARKLVEQNHTDSKSEKFNDMEKGDTGNA